MSKQFCCSSCFSDEFLKKHIVANSTIKGTCKYCSTKKSQLIDPKELLKLFEPLLDLYEPDKTGKDIFDLLNDDWSVFSTKICKPFGLNGNDLISEITNDTDYTNKKYKPKHVKDDRNIKIWEEFREELKHGNRFFPNVAPDEKDLTTLGEYLGKEIEIKSVILYRSRINHDGEIFALSEMGKPPKEKTKNGRANPIGIPYLYLSTSKKTAISELRANKGEIVTVAEYSVNEKLELIDLCNPQNKISPFELEDSDQLKLIYKNMPYLVMLENELSKPIIPREANLEYLPSQYLCELFKKIGFHGIIFNSSLTDETNFVIFNDEKLSPLNSKRYLITHSEYEYKETP